MLRNKKKEIMEKSFIENVPKISCLFACLIIVFLICVYNDYIMLPTQKSFSRSLKSMMINENISSVSQDSYTVPNILNVTNTKLYDVVNELEETTPNDVLKIESTLDSLDTEYFQRTNKILNNKKLAKAKGKFKLTDFYDIKPNIMNIFFIESTCGIKKQEVNKSSDEGVLLNARQTCAIESTSRMNPNRLIYILHTCPLDNTFYKKSPKYIQQLMTYPNVHLTYMQLSDLFNNSIVENLYFEGKFEESSYPVEHVSDVMRVLTLWKFGGTYIDIDVVSIRPLDELGVNYAGWQDEQTVATGVMNFAPTGFGHGFLTTWLEKLTIKYDPYEWSTNGPILFTELLKNICNIFHVELACKDFTVYDTTIFYPLYYTEWYTFFDEKDNRNAFSRLDRTYIIHIWNRMSKKGVIRVGSNQAYAILADQYCPKAYHNCGDTF